MLRKPPLPRDKSQTIIGGCKPEAKPVGNTETGNQNKKHQTLSSF
uniref:Uncharacterized protein n=1 Tax=Brassica campestris TaxID=3711 RepID=A0A3P5YCM2_BRACM|nr:unnamed protein product [Brassica rapa]